MYCVRCVTRLQDTRDVPSFVGVLLEVFKHNWQISNLESVTDRICQNCRTLGSLLDFVNSLYALYRHEVSRAVSVTATWRRTWYHWRNCAEWTCPNVTCCVLLPDLFDWACTVTLYMCVQIWKYQTSWMSRRPDCPSAVPQVSCCLSPHTSRLYVFSFETTIVFMLHLMKLLEE